MTLKAVLDLLLASAGVTDLCGQRIHINVIPQDVQSGGPCVALTLVDEVPANSLCGDGSLDNARVQVDCYARDSGTQGGYLQADELARAVRAALRDATAFGSWCLSRRDSYDEGTKLHRCSLDFSIWRQT